MWNYDAGAWDDFADGETVDWDDRCIACHVTGFNGRTDELARFTEPGVGCEACHGPGNKHVRLPGAGNIANPARFSVARRTGLCGSCHYRGANLTSPGREDAYGFLPGEDLSTVVSVYRSSDAPELYWPDGDAKYNRMQYNEYLGSPHFLSGLVNCSTCHNSHGRSNHNEPLKATAEQICAVCHGEVLDIDRYLPKVARSVNPNDIRTHTFGTDHPDQW